MSQDRRTRRLGRSDDPADRRLYARERVRQGQWRVLSTADLLEQNLVSPERIALARAVLEAGWADWFRRSGLIRDAVRDAVKLLGYTLPARLAADYAARIPQIIAGRAAIEAARAWADDPTEGNRLAAKDASGAAWHAATRHAAADYEAPAEYDYDASVAARAAARAAATAARAAAYAAAAATVDAATAVDAADDAADVAYAAAERNWQKWRLVRYLVAPDFPTPVPITDRPDAP